MTSTLALRAEPGEPRGLLAWLVPTSLAVHAVVLAWAPAAVRTPRAEPVVVEMAPPPEEPLPPAPPAPEEPAAVPSSPVAAPAPKVAAAAPRAAAAAPAAAEEPSGPVDFSSTVFAGEGPGVAVGSRYAGNGSGSGPGPARVAAAPAATGAGAGLALVDVKQLARRPRAPGLDAELERQYPTEARLAGIEGVAVLRVQILPDGSVGSVRAVSESYRGFAPACTRTVRSARWEPPLDREGKPVATEITYTCRFEVRG